MGKCLFSCSSSSWTQILFFSWQEFKGLVALLGFVGASWTIATYVVEGEQLGHTIWPSTAGATLLLISEGGRFWLCYLPSRVWGSLYSSIWLMGRSTSTPCMGTEVKTLYWRGVSRHQNRTPLKKSKESHGLKHTDFNLPICCSNIHSCDLMLLKYCLILKIYVEINFTAITFYINSSLHSSPPFTWSASIKSRTSSNEWMDGMDFMMEHDHIVHLDCLSDSRSHHCSTESPLGLYEAQAWLDVGVQRRVLYKVCGSVLFCFFTCT